ncbi:MAG: FHA domain-containing protein [Gemmataceae bacterium]
MKTTRFADRLDKSEPGLIVRNGNTARKHIALQRSGVTLGRARGCDIQLEAPDVSALHCIITRGSAGVFIRDCGSRHGTKVNGVKIEEAPLHSTDVIQIGSFSFEVYLPWTQTPLDPDSAKIEVCKAQLGRAERSRERLAGLALQLRKRLHEERAARAQAMVDTWPVPPRQRDKPGQAVQTQTGDQAQREAELLAREKASADRQLQLDQQAAELERARRELERERQEYATQLERARPEHAAPLGQNRQDAEQPRPRFTAPRRASATQLGDVERDLVMTTLQQRRQELENYAGKLREAYEQLSAQETELRQLAEEVRDGREHIRQAREELEAERAQLETTRAALLARRDELECKQAELEARTTQVRDSEASQADLNLERARLDDIAQLLHELCGQAVRRHESDAAAFRELCDQLGNMTR